MITIQQAQPSDAPFIAKAIMAAIGNEITLEFAGSEERIPLVFKTFSELATKEHTQYSYLNTIVARDSDTGATAGAIISYDGDGLIEMRRHFFAAAKNILGLEFDDSMPVETDGEEIYIDTLAVSPEYRRKGIAKKLIDAVINRHRNAGKPIGLLVEPENSNAYRLYRESGFTYIGQRPFAGTMMHHLQLKIR